MIKKRGKVILSVYEKWSDTEEYIYLKKRGQPSLPGMTHEIYCSVNFHKSFEFIFLTAGEQEISINSERDVAYKDEIVFAGSFMPHSFAKSETADGYILVLNDWYLQFFKNLYQNKAFPTVMRDHELNRKIIEYVAAWHLDQEGGKYKKFNQANIFLEMLCDAYPPREIKHKRSNEIVVNILSFIDENYMEDISFNIIADALGYAKEYCSKLFNQVVDENFRSYLNRVRVSKFNQIWSSPGLRKDRTILQIAYDCGFESQSTFYRAYREVCGTTPAALRRGS